MEALAEHDEDVEFKDMKNYKSGEGVDKLFKEMTKLQPRIIYVDVVPDPPNGWITTHHSFAIVTTGVDGNFKMIQSWINKYKQEISIDTTTSEKAMLDTRNFVLNMIKTGGGGRHYVEESMKSLFFPGGKTLPKNKFYQKDASSCKFVYKSYPISGCSFQTSTADDRVMPSDMLLIGAHAFSHRKSEQAIETVSEVELMGDIDTYCTAFCSKIHWSISLFKCGCNRSCRSIERTAMDVMELV